MDKDTLHLLHDTIAVTLECLKAETTEFIPEIGCVTQTIWSTNQVAQIQKQLQSYMRQLPDPKYFQ